MGGVTSCPPVGARRGPRWCVFQGRKKTRSRHQRLFEENIEKIKMEKVEGLCILKMKVLELFTYGEGISTRHVCHKGRQPLIKCANHDFKTMYFPFLCCLFPFLFFLTFVPFLCFLLFWGRQGCFPRSYVFLNCDEEIRPTHFFKN